MRVREKTEGEPVRRMHVPSHVPMPARTAAIVRGFSPPALECTTETDSTLEEAGFELLVPLRNPRTNGQLSRQARSRMGNGGIGLASRISTTSFGDYWTGSGDQLRRVTTAGADPRNPSGPAADRPHQRVNRPSRPAMCSQGRINMRVRECLRTWVAVLARSNSAAPASILPADAERVGGIDLHGTSVAAVHFAAACEEAGYRARP